MSSSNGLAQSHIATWRVVVIYVALALVFSVYSYRLFSLQVLEGETYRTQAEENRTKIINIQTTRGLIYDRNGYILASNAPSYNVVITPAELPGNPVLVMKAYRELYDFDYTEEAGAVQEVYRKLSDLIDVPVITPNLWDEDGYIQEIQVKNFSPCYSDLGITEIVIIGDTNAPYSPIEIKCNIDERTAMIIRSKAAELPGVSIAITPVREYPTGWLTSEIIGFLGPIPAAEEDYYESLGLVPNRDKVGYAGVEATLQDILSGTNGQRVVEVDNAGQILRDIEAPIDPIPGNNVRLTIDTRLQTAAKEILLDEMEGWNNWFGYERYNNGVVIAMNPQTGEILALVSYPSYENNRMAREIPAYYYNQLISDPRRPLFNHAISAEHPPGSVFKMAAAIGILNEGVVTPEQEIFDAGVIEIEERFTPNDPNPGTREYVCYTYKTTGAGHGDVDYLHGIALSCDVYFYKVGGGYEDEVPEGLGIWRLGEYARALGYGSQTGIELPGEGDGFMPDPTWKRIYKFENWSTGDTYISTIGQGYVTSTPLQVLVSVATLANDGKMMKPTLIREVLDAEGNVVTPFTPVEVWDITKDPLIHVYDENYLRTDELKTVEPWVIDMAQQGMRMVVTEGTASAYFEGFDIPSGGKTGTAEYCDDIASARDICKPGAWPAHAWYVGYAPFDNPEIAIVAFVYNGDEGSKVAAPIVRRIMEVYFALKQADAGQQP
ncbi:MAG TPA: penicillin-binding protein 2 [Anaerolineaceae bacterium]|nr:penicillin-binding protein 2 [Anaerolineaceae bacterium]HQF62347.1 penicillin-binding protein 2 [Anaerolineaceae bacterium]HQH85473.1 penicillin-binding protein 2 [Anaerolineaceae bacterium]